MKKILTLFALTIFLYFSAICQNQNMDSIVNVGIQKFDEQNYSDALAEFEKVLLTDKMNEKAIIGKINSLIKLDKIKNASGYVEDNLNKYNNEPIFNFAKGIILNYKDQFKKAVEEFNIVLNNAKSETLKKAHISRGIAYQAMKDYDLAIEDFTKYLEYDKENVNALYYRGFTYYLQEEYNNAINDFENVIAKDSENAYAYYNLGMSYYRSNKLLNACKNFQSACQLNVTNACKMILTDCIKNY